MGPTIKPIRAQKNYIILGTTTYVFDNSNVFESSKTFDGISELPNVNTDAPIITSIK